MRLLVRLGLTGKQQQQDLVTGLGFASQGNVIDLCHTVINRLFNNQGKRRKGFPSIISVSFICFSSLSILTLGLYCVRSKPQVIIQFNLSAAWLWVQTFSSKDHKNTTVVVLQYAMHSGSQRANISHSMWRGGFLWMQVSHAALWFSCTVAKDPH